MAVQKQDGLFTDTLLGDADLTGKEFYFCTRNADGTVGLAGNGEKIAGVISEGKVAAKHTSFNTGGGMLKVLAGGTIAIGDNVQSDANGAAVSGSTNAAGIASSAAIAGQLVEYIPDRV